MFNFSLYIYVNVLKKSTVNGYTMKIAKHSVYEGHLRLEPQQYRTVILFRHVIKRNQIDAKKHYKNCKNYYKNCNCN